MKKIILSALFLCFFFSVIAQDNSKAKAILEGVSLQTKSYSSIDIAFTFTLNNTLKKTKDSKTGNACIKGDKYRMEYQGQEIICDGKTIWTYIKENNEVQINNNDADDDETLNPVTLLSDYHKTFSPKFIKEETRGARIFQILDLTPLKSYSFYRIRLEIDKNQKQIVNAIIYDKDGVNVYTYSIIKFETGKEIQDSKFTFIPTDYPDIEIVDLR